MKLAILDYQEAVLDIWNYSGLNDSEAIEEFLINEGYNLDSINWMIVNNDLPINYKN